MDHAGRIERFYAAFASRDGEAMAAFYAPDARFHDPAFGELSGEEAGDMWRMLTARAGELKIDLREHDERSAHWVARYTFGQTGRLVVNDVRASFRFDEDGRFAEHVDTFSFWRWARQAIGPVGLALGWSPLMRKQVRDRAREQLAAFRASRGR